MKKIAFGTILIAAAAFGQVTLPEGTKLRLRLEQSLSSATAKQGHEVEFTVLEDVTQDNITVIPMGARAVGTILQAQEHRRMGRAGKLDFSIERARAADGKYVALRYTQTAVKGSGRALATGLVAAGVGLVFLPAAPIALLIKGKDIEVSRGTTYEAFTDTPFTLQKPPSKTESASPSVTPAQAAPAPVAPIAQTHAVPAAPSTGIILASANSAHQGDPIVSITSDRSGLDVEIDGAFVGSVPSSLALAPGTHRVVVRSGPLTWQKDVTVAAGSRVSLHAAFDTPSAMPTVRQ